MNEIFIHTVLHTLQMTTVNALFNLVLEKYCKFLCSWVEMQVQRGQPQLLFRSQLRDFLETSLDSQLRLRHTHLPRLTGYLLKKAKDWTYGEHSLEGIQFVCFCSCFRELEAKLDVSQHCFMRRTCRPDVVEQMS